MNSSREALQALREAFKMTDNSLFGEDERWTEKANRLHDKHHSYIKKVFEEAINDGLKLREVSYVLQWIVRDVELEALIGSRR